MHLKLLFYIFLLLLFLYFEIYVHTIGLINFCASSLFAGEWDVAARQRRQHTERKSSLFPPVSSFLPALPPSRYRETLPPPKAPAASKCKWQTPWLIPAHPWRANFSIVKRNVDVDARRGIMERFCCVGVADSSIVAIRSNRFSTICKPLLLFYITLQMWE